MKHPVQPLIRDDKGVIRFKENKIVNFLFKTSSYDLTEFALMNFDSNDWEQFAQLIGYSLSGFAELDYVSDETYNKAEEGRDEIPDQDS